MIRGLRRWVLWGCVACIATLGAVVAWTFLWPKPDPASIARADAILCLGTGLEPDGTLRRDALARVEACAALYAAGAAPVVVFSGGLNSQAGVTEGDTMALAAMAQGVPEAAILIEAQAQSTLQNALFSLPLVPDAGRLILVTQAFHLPRSWLSFRWAGADELVLYPAGRVEQDGFGVSALVMVRETLAIWFNLLRASAYSLGGLAGIAEETRIPWLR